MDCQKMCGIVLRILWNVCSTSCHELRFHVQDLSSAHVYLRLKKNERLEDVPPSTLQECAQLVKANSIEGCKLNHVHISSQTTILREIKLEHILFAVYTRWRNLKKTSDMEVGAIGFHDSSKVKTMRVERDNNIVKMITKTKQVKLYYTLLHSA